MPDTTTAPSRDKTNKPVVTVVTITKNLMTAGRENCFRQCVESVRCQDYSPIEHLIIDGGSTDGTIGLLEELGLNYFSESDTGIYDAFNKGIRRAAGKYITFLNSDDYFSKPNSVSLSVTQLEQSNADFSYADHTMISLEGEYLETRKACWEACFYCMPAGHQTMFCTKKMLEQLGGFDTSFVIAGDYDLVIRALLSEKRSVYVPEAIVHFRNGGMSTIYCALIRQEIVRLLQKNCAISQSKAKRLAEYGALDSGTMHRLVLKAKYHPCPDALIKNNRRNLLRMLRKLLVTVHTGKGRRLVRLFGITFYNEMTQ